MPRHNEKDKPKFAAMLDALKLVDDLVKGSRKMSAANIKIGLAMIGPVVAAAITQAEKPSTRGS